MTVSADLLIPVGRITGTHGVRGQLKLLSYSGNYESLKKAGNALLRSSDGTTKSLTIKSVTVHGSCFLLALSGFDNINQVTGLVGGELCLERSQLPQPEEDEYYWCDLIGLKVLATDGNYLGTIADIIETGANDVYVVKSGSREYMIPATASVINEVNIKEGFMTVTPLEGLLEI